MKPKSIAGFFFGALLLLAGLSFMWSMIVNENRVGPGFGDILILAAFLGGGIILIWLGYRSSKIEKEKRLRM